MNKLIGLYRLLGVLFVLSNGLEKSYSYFSPDFFKVIRNMKFLRVLVLIFSEREVLLRLHILIKISSVSRKTGISLTASKLFKILCKNNLDNRKYVHT